MVEDYIMQMRPFFGQEEKSAVCNYMDQDGFITEFKNTEYFEKLICEYTKSKFCVVVNNGTVALTLAAIALGVKAGDEVIVPNYTMIATPNSVALFGAKPIFVDVEKSTLCIDFKLLKKQITSKTKAIILVSPNGRFPTYQVDELKNLCKERKILLIEDAAQSLGSFYPDGKHIGTIGDAGCFSFSAPKIISTGQGGAIVTNDKSIYLKLKKLKDFGRVGGGHDVHDSIGFNFKFTELQACIGIEQIKKLASRVIRKKEIFKLYEKNLSTIKEVHIYRHDLRYTTPWFIDCIVEDREKLIEFLHKRNIGTRVMYPPINSQKIYYSEKEYPISELIGKKGLWLPSYIQLTDEEINLVSNEIRNFYK